jgi:hypothetical protein
MMKLHCFHVVEVCLYVIDFAIFCEYAAPANPRCHVRGARTAQLLGVRYFARAASMWDARHTARATRMAGVRQHRNTRQRATQEQLRPLYGCDGLRAGRHACAGARPSTHPALAQAATDIWWHPDARSQGEQTELKSSAERPARSSGTRSRSARQPRRPGQTRLPSPAWQ